MLFCLAGKHHVIFQSFKKLMFLHKRSEMISKCNMKRSFCREQEERCGCVIIVPREISIELKECLQNAFHIVLTLTSK